jgi:hypothetical protein
MQLAHVDICPLPQVIDGGQSHGAKGYVEAKQAIEAKSNQEKKGASGGVFKAAAKL